MNRAATDYRLNWRLKHSCEQVGRGAGCVRVCSVRVFVCVEGFRVWSENELASVGFARRAAQ